MLNKKKLKIMYTCHICIIYHEIMSKIYMGFISLSYVNGISNQYSEIKFPDFLSAMTFRSNFEKKIFSKFCLKTISLCYSDSKNI